MMRKILLFICGLVLAGVSGVAQSTITFKVDMSEYTGDYTDVHLSGTFNEWCGGCATMLDDDDDGVYELAVADVPNGQIEYKFNLDSWTEQESFPPGFGECTLTTGNFVNRVLQVDGDVELPVVCWNSCAVCGDGPQISDVTFKVDMNDYTGAAYTTVNLNGVFNEWCGGCTEMTDSDADGIYEITLAIVGGTIEYKFTLDGWTVQEEFAGGESCTTTLDEFTNRSLEVSENTVLPAVCWEACLACGVENVADFTAATISVFPNPTNGFVTIEGAEGMDVQMVSITDLQGTLVAQKNTTTLQNLDFSSLDAGVYQLVLSGKTQLAKRLIVE